MTAAEKTTGRLSVLPPVALTASADELYAVIAAGYDVDTLPVQIGGELFAMLHVRDSNVLLDQVSPELFSVDERLPYWADLWTSAMDLARWLLEDPAMVSGKTALEIGSGIGLAGIAAARAGARVTMTDYETDALLFARYNAIRNLPATTFQRSVRCAHLDWRTPDLDEKFDVIVGADIVYERKNFHPVLSLLETHLAPGGRALLTEPGRTVGQLFLEAARERPFSVEQSYSTVERDGRAFRISRICLTTP